MQERVFITGRGLITPLGNGLKVNEEALRSGKSGIVHAPALADRNLPSTVGGLTDEKPPTDLVNRKMMRFCPASGMMSVAAVEEALHEAGLSVEDVRGKNIAVIGGVAGGNYTELFAETLSYHESGRLRSVSPFVIPRVMPSSANSVLSLVFGFTGESYDISAACSSSALSVMVATRLVRYGVYDMVIVGGTEQFDWVQGLGFSVIHALSTRYNDTPELSSRPFDRGRDGFVLASGAAYVLLESQSSVERRNARPITEITGVSSNSNAKDMVVPDASSCRDVMNGALHDAGLKCGDIGYVNTHGTATPVGDPVEMAAIKEVFGGSVAVNSTKSQTGHMVGATGAAEIIFTSMMLERNFISRSINLEDPEPEFSWSDLVKEYREGTSIRHALSNSFAFGGSNVSVVLSDCGTK